MKSLSLYSICLKPLSDIKKFFDRKYGFKVNNRSAIKYVVKNIDVRFLRTSIDNKLPNMVTERIPVDDETYNKFHSLMKESGYIGYKPEDILSGYVIHISKILNSSP